MHIHTSTTHMISQLSTLLRLVESQIDDVAQAGADGSIAAFECRIQHLRNAFDLVSTWAMGADFALEEMLPILGQHADSGAIAHEIVQELLEPLNEHMGPCFVDAALAWQQG